MLNFKKLKEELYAKFQMLSSRTKLFVVLFHLVIYKPFPF